MSGFNMAVTARAKTIALAAVSLAMGMAAITLTLGVSSAHAGFCMSLPCVPSGGIEKNLDAGGNAPSGSGWGLPGDSDGDGYQDSPPVEVVFSEGEGEVIQAGGPGSTVIPPSPEECARRAEEAVAECEIWANTSCSAGGLISMPVGVACRYVYQRLCHAIQRETERRCNSGFGP